MTSKHRGDNWVMLSLTATELIWKFLQSCSETKEFFQESLTTFANTFSICFHLVFFSETFKVLKAKTF